VERRAFLGVVTGGLLAAPVAVPSLARPRRLAEFERLRRLLVALALVVPEDALAGALVASA